MQVKIARMLNVLFLIVSGITMAVWAGYFLYARNYPEISNFYLMGAIFSCIFIMFGFVWLEQNWDKRIIMRMTKSGNIAAANIKSAKKLTIMRDAGFRQYWLYEIVADVYDKSHNKSEKKIYEKMKYTTEQIPVGTVFITYDEDDPGCMFVIPNALISFQPELAAIVQSYESDKKINVKYLDVYYNKGMVIRTYDEAFKERMNTDANLQSR